MSVQPGPTFKRYAANGVATVYTIPFLLLDAADLQVTLDGVLITSGFTLAGIGNPTSSCTFSVAPTGDLLFQQLVPFQRLADYQINGDFLAETVNRDFDRVWLAIKQLNRDSGRALTVSQLEPEGIPPLPAKAQRALHMLAFDSLGNVIPSNLTMAQIEQQPALAIEAVEIATTAAETAANDASSATASAALAQKWATNPEDSPVVTGFFSALHWAIKAAASAASAAATLANAVLKTGAQTMAGPLTVTGGIASIPFNKEFISSQQVMATAAGITLPHGLGVDPKIVEVHLVCITASDGYAVGDKVAIMGQHFDTAAASNDYGVNIRFDATNLYLRFGVNGCAIIFNPNTGGIVTLSNVSLNFRMVVKAWA